MNNISKNAFSQTQTATSTAEKLWAIYSDVENWKQWDTELESSSLDGHFDNGSIGKLKSKGSPEVKFVLTDVVINKSFTSESNIPFGKLVIDHQIKEIKNGIEFTHTVYFTGILAGVFDFLLGRGFRKALPGVLLNLKSKVENNV